MFDKFYNRFLELRMSRRCCYGKNCAAAGKRLEDSLNLMNDRDVLLFDNDNIYIYIYIYICVCVCVRVCVCVCVAMGDAPKGMYFYVNSIVCAFLLAMNKKLSAVLLKFSTWNDDIQFHSKDDGIVTWKMFLC